MTAPPTQFGHERMVPTNSWGMLGNDGAGDCVFSGTGHEIKLWCAEAGVPDISDQTALRNYQWTGYDPTKTDPVTGDNPTDQGTDVAAWLSQRRKVGFLDDHGNAHKIGAYLALKPGDINQLLYALYYFDGVGIGINFPQQWMNSFQQGGRTWSALRNPNYVGGHYISGVAYRNGHIIIVTWGKLVELTVSAYKQVTDEVYAYLTPEKLRNGVDLEFLNYPKLTDYLKQLKAVQ